MIDTHIDTEILLDFQGKIPKVVAFEETQGLDWRDFFKYLQNKTNLIIYDNGILNQVTLFNNLTINRGKTKISIKDESFKKPHKCKLPNGTKAETVFLINETEPDTKEKYTKENGYLFGFTDNYTEKVRLLITDCTSTIPFYNSINLPSWSALTKHLLTCTDVVLIDPFILLDKSLINSNIIEIIKVFSKVSTVKINFTIVTHGIQSKEIYDILHSELVKQSISVELSIISTNTKFHDRTIITNYQRLRSGDSFNYFLSNGQLATKGTELDIIPNTSESHWEIIETLFNKIREIVGKNQNQTGEFKKNKLLFPNFNKSNLTEI